MRIPSTFAPNFIEGFGLPILDHAVYMAGATNGHNMLYTNGSFTPTSSPAVAFNISCDATSLVPLSLVLVWTDPAGSVSSRKQLINDIDLIVIADETQLFGNMRPFADQLNTVERVALPMCPASGKVTAIVALGEPLKTSDQTWYLVSNGAVTQISAASVPPLANRGRALPLATQANTCRFLPTITITVQFRPSASWRCTGSCDVEKTTFAASLAQAIGVSGQSIRVLSSSAASVSVLLMCSSAVSAWQDAVVSVKYITPSTIQSAIQAICQQPASLCSSDASLSAFDWASLSIVEPPAAKASVSIAYFNLSNCADVADTFRNAPNPFTFTDQSCFPGRNIMVGLISIDVFYRAVSCRNGTAEFTLHHNDPTCSSQDPLATKFVVVNGNCTPSVIPSDPVFQSVNCMDLAPATPAAAAPPPNTACPQGNLCLAISDHAFIAIMALVSAHVVQFGVWVYLAKKRLVYNRLSALALLLLPGLGLFVWRSVCCSSSSKRNPVLLQNVLHPVDPSTTLSSSKSPSSTHL
jgi:hypothetical protein